MSHFPLWRKKPRGRPHNHTKSNTSQSQMSHRLTAYMLVLSQQDSRGFQQQPCRAEPLETNILSGSRTSLLDLSHGIHFKIRFHPSIPRYARAQGCTDPPRFPMRVPNPTKANADSGRIASKSAPCQVFTNPLSFP